MSIRRRIRFGAAGNRYRRAAGGRFLKPCGRGFGIRELDVACFVHPEDACKLEAWTEVE